MTHEPARLLEVIVSSVEDARAAHAGGADRVEVVVRLDADGLTPPRALVEAMLAAVTIPLRVMVRPEDVFVVNDPAARARIEADARQWADLPLDGLVTGYVTADGRVDEALLRAVAEATPHPITFHRAIERVTAGDAIAALHRCPAVDRILSGGGGGDWPVRLAALEGLQQDASPLRVIAGGGVDAAGLDVLAASYVVREVHIGRFVRADGRIEGTVQAEAVRRVRARLG